MTERAASVLLQAEGPGAGPDMSFFLMMGAIFMIFYLLVMRPQQKQQRTREAAIKAAAKGDRVVTNGGIHGVITGVSEDTVTVDIAHLKGGLRVEVEVSRSGLASVVKAGSAEASEKSEKGEKSEKDRKGGEGA